MEEQYLGKGEDKMHKIPFEVLVVGLFFPAESRKNPMCNLFLLSSLLLIPK